MISDNNQTLPQGTKLNNGQYVINKVLGQGGFGITYRAHDTILDNPVAIKEFFPHGYVQRYPDSKHVHPAGNDGREIFKYGLERYVEEARALAKFNHHSGVVSVLYFFNENGTAYMVMEYLEGTTIKEWLTTHGDRVSWDEAVNILMPVMDTLNELHCDGLIHRDLSPDNIYMCQSGQIKLLDFGAARQALGDHSRSLSVILKPGFAPFEQYTSRGKQGPWTDVYALGATLFRMVTGHVLPDSPDRIEHDEVPELIKNNSNIPIPCRTALLKALAVRVSDRFKNVDEFQEMIIKSSASKSPVMKEFVKPALKAVASPPKRVVKPEPVAPRKAPVPESDKETVPMVSSEADEASVPLPEPIEKPEIQLTPESEKVTVPLSQDNSNPEKSIELGSSYLAPTISFKGEEQNDEATIPLNSYPVGEVKQSLVESNRLPTRYTGTPKKKNDKAGMNDSRYIVALLIWIIVLLPLGWYVYIYESDDYNKTEQTTNPDKSATGQIVNPDIYSAGVGDIVNYGMYEQDNNTSNGKEAIAWRVLAVENGRILLISEYGLDRRSYNEAYTDVTWETCELRKWLNSDFVNNAFSSGELDDILVTSLHNLDNIEYGTEGGNSTQDKLFLLSVDEAVKYFASNDSRAAKPSAYSANKGVYTDASNGNCWWLLRSVGNTSTSAAYVYSDGEIRIEGTAVFYDNAAVRPALWLNR